MPEGLKYTVEELHEMHKRVVLNGIFSKQRNGEVLGKSDIQGIIMSADAMLHAVDEMGYA